MWRWRMLVAFLAVGSAGVGFAQALDSKAPPPTPRIVFESTAHDFGRVSDQGELRHTFKFSNAGLGTLTLRDYRSGTGPSPRSTTPPFDVKWEYGPGESGSIDVLVNAHGKRGEIRQRHTVLCNDPAYPREGPVLLVRAFIRPVITFDPPSCQIGEVLIGAKGSGRITVIGDKPDFGATYLSVSRGRYVKARLVKHEIVNVNGEPCGSTTFELLLDTAGLQVGDFNATATVRTNHAECWLADFPISAMVVGDLRLLPPRVNLGVLAPRESFRRTFRIESRTGTAFTISKVDQRGQGVGCLGVICTPEDPFSPSTYVIALTGEAGPDKAAIAAVISLLTDSATSPTVDFRLTGAVRER